MPSARVLESKKSVVSGLAEEFKSALTIVVADARGLTVAEDTELRNNMRKAGVTYKVVKNTLASRAAKDAGLEGMDEVFKGPSAIAYSSEDAVSPARILKEFADKHKAVELKGGSMEGRVVGLKEIVQLASIPSIDVLRAQLVGGLVSPIAALAIYLNEIAKKCEEAGAQTASEVWQGPKAEEAQEDASTQTKDLAE